MSRLLFWILGACLALGTAGASVMLVPGRQAVDPGAPTVGEKLAALKAERATLLARAGGEARVSLIVPLRTASLLTDALAVRGEQVSERTLERQPAPWRQALADVDALNVILREAVERRGTGTSRLAKAASDKAQASLEQLAGGDEHPLVLGFAPRFVAPRLARGELSLLPAAPEAIPQVDSVQLGSASRRPDSAAAPTVPRYAPAFAPLHDDEPPVEVEIVGLRLAAGVAPVLAIGTWRGEAVIAPERLRFSVPRSAFTTDATRTTLVTGMLVVRRDARTTVFDLPFVVLPDRPGAVALDQKVRTVVPEANTLVSPEILARAGAGESRTVRRCFDPPEGWRFDKDRRRVIVVERLAWMDDVADATFNTGSVEFAADEKAEQICLIVAARPTTKGARTATIGRFEATLVRERSEERGLQSGVRALDWREPVRLPIDAGAVASRLYVRLFDEMDREFEGLAAIEVPFLRIAPSADGWELILRADATAEP